MYQWDAENGRWDATHNPFSGVVPEDEALLVTASGDPARPSPDDPAGRARAMQYDLALNGWELGGGSVRIHRRDLLERSFLLQGHTIEGMREKFGAILDAFEYGAPPHGGIALGIDRWAALLADQTNIREVMAFPKTQSGSDPMLEAPLAARPDPVRGARPAVRRAAVQGAAGLTGRDQALTTRPQASGIAPLDAIAASAAAGGPRRRAVHLVLRDLLPVGRGVAGDGHGLPGVVRAAAAGRSSRWPSGGATARCRPHQTAGRHRRASSSRAT